MSAIPLSEKAKGKQRAVKELPPNQTQAVPTGILTKTLVIRFSEGIPDLTLQVSEKDAVRDVKRQVCSSWTCSLDSVDSLYHRYEREGLN